MGILRTKALNYVSAYSRLQYIHYTTLIIYFKYVYYHAYNHSKQLELLVGLIFSHNIRDFCSDCWGEFGLKKNSTLFNGIDGTGAMYNIKT